MRKKLVVLLGAHASGKTTFGKSLPSDTFTYYEEIGSSLRASVNFGVTSRQENFDHEVMVRELARDRRILTDALIPVVETWHIGNIAFALARHSKATVAEYEEFFSRQRNYFQVMVVQFEIPDHEFLNRVNEKNVSPGDALRFYRNVERYYRVLIEKYLDAGQYFTLHWPWDSARAPELLTQAIQAANANARRPKC